MQGSPQFLKILQYYHISRCHGIDKTVYGPDSWMGRDVDQLDTKIKKN